MRRIRAFGAGIVVAALAVTLAGMAAAPASAQSAGFNQGRDCQTVRTCNFSRHGRYRGCLSSYTCRTCRLVTARCTVGSAQKCQRFVCGWGG
jgi:hypothetical protein